MYNNIGKRDILIFPKFDNIDLIQKIRKKYDRLADLVEPHITLAFPFSDNMSNDDLIDNLCILLKNYSPFAVTFRGVSLSDDNYIFLNCIEGTKEIVKLHDDIYKEIIPNLLNTSIKYIPHITLGQADIIKDSHDFDYAFSTIIDEVSIELIGENEESIIIKNIKLGGF